MKASAATLAAAIALASTLCLFGCNAQPANENKSSIEASANTAIFEEMISPNADWAASEADIVYYTVKVTLSESGTATVSAESNSGFFEPTNYEIECAENLTADDITIKWTTLMGNPEPSENDQLAIAAVLVRTADGGTDERTINFVDGALEMIAETVRST